MIGGHVSLAKRGHKLACHILLERSGSLLTPSSAITQFRAHLPGENIKMVGPVWSGINLYGLED